MSLDIGGDDDTKVAEEKGATLKECSNPFQPSAKTDRISLCLKIDFH